MTKRLTVHRWENTTTDVSYTIDVPDDYDWQADQWFEPWTFPMVREDTAILNVNDTGEWKEIKP